MKLEVSSRPPLRSGIPHDFVQWFDADGDNVVTLNMNRQVKVDDTFTFDGITYRVEYAETGRGVLRMIRQRIPDESTTVVHKCPNRQREIEGMTEDDVIKIKEALGDKTFQQHKKGRVKMNHHNKVSLVCPHCKVEFWKKNNKAPEPVTVEVALDDIENETYEGGLEKQDLDKKVKDGTWIE